MFSHHQCLSELQRPRYPGKKKPLKVCEAFRGKKISGAVLLSHSQICSTIAAGVLNYRVREGNVCDSPAMDAEKYYNEEKHVFGINHVEAQHLLSDTHFSRDSLSYGKKGG